LFCIARRVLLEIGALGAFSEFRGSGPWGTEWWRLSIGLVATRELFVEAVCWECASTLSLTCCNALSSSEKSEVEPDAAPCDWSITNDCLALVAAHGAHPALASISSEFGDMGVW